jgi:peroxiredoxin
MKLLAWMILPLMVLSTYVVSAQDAPKPDTTDEKKSDEKKEDEGEESKEAEKEKEVEVEPDKATLDKLAPSFTLKNADGKDVKLADFKGKIVVLEWINLDCPWCKAHYEDGDALVKMQGDLRKEDVVWLTICSSGAGKQGNFEGDTLKKRIEKVSLKTEHYLIDADGAVGKKYEAKTTPHCYVIDKEQKLRYRGALDNLRDRRKDKALEEVNYVKLAIDALKADKKIDKTDTKPYG